MIDKLCSYLESFLSAKVLQDNQPDGGYNNNDYYLIINEINQSSHMIKGDLAFAGNPEELLRKTEGIPLFSKDGGVRVVYSLHSTNIVYYQPFLFYFDRDLLENASNGIQTIQQEVING